mgnify:CR=1 FL=1
MKHKFSFISLIHARLIFILLPARHLLPILLTGGMAGGSCIAFAQTGKKDDINSDYKKGMEYYNKGISIINNQDSVIIIGGRKEIPTSAITQYESALPYLSEVYKQTPKDKKILTALMGIYFAKKDIERYDKYKKELELLNGK